MAVSSQSGLSKRSSVRSKGKDLCIWVVSPFGGQVKKMRLGVWLVGCIACFSFLGLAGVSLMAGDYARLQILKARNYLYLKAVSAERDSLKSSNHSLQGQLEQMKAKQGQLESYEQGVKKRISELEAVVSAVQAMGISAASDAKPAEFARPTLKNGGAEKSAGIGGAEIECKPGDIRCSGLLLDGEEVEMRRPGLGSRILSGVEAPFKYVGRKTSAVFSSHVAMQREIDREGVLLSQLDRYIGILKVLPFGIPGVASISSAFGYRNSPFTNRVALHEGIDFALPAGSEVASTGDGVVKEVRFTPTYGLVIDIEHTPQVMTRYAHLRKALVHDGQKIARGDIIGLVGSTGRSTGPHLHYEVRVNGEAKNPGEMIALGERLSSVF